MGDIVRRAKLEVEDPTEVIQLITNIVEEAIPDDLNDVDPNKDAITPAYLSYAVEAGILFSPKVVLKEKNGLLKVWIHGKYLQSVLSTSLGREISPSGLRSVILDLGGRTSVKLGIGPSDVKGRRGYEFPTLSLPQYLQDRLKEYYDSLEEAAAAKLRNIEGEKNE